jgi:hypothetical protein
MKPGKDQPFPGFLLIPVLSVCGGASLEKRLMLLNWLVVVGAGVRSNSRFPSVCVGSGKLRSWMRGEILTPAWRECRERTCPESQAICPSKALGFFR